MIIAETSGLLDRIPNIRHGFFTRHGGVSQGHFYSLNCSLLVGDDPKKVTINRQKILDYLELNGNQELFLPSLNHSNQVLYLTHAIENYAHVATPADAAITTTINSPLGVTYADCLPLLFASRDGIEIAAVHAGWRGIYSGVIANTVASMRTKPANIVAAIGPCISGESYFVGEDLFCQFKERYPFSVSNDLDGFRVDLLKIALYQLETLGVQLMEKVGHFTDKDTNNYFSHRKDQGKTGRMLAVIAKIPH